MRRIKNRVIRQTLTFAVALLGLGTFATNAPAQTYIFGQADFPTGPSPVALVAADFNGDGKLDLATANFGDNTVSILIGKPDGTFQPHVDYTVGTSPSALTTADFNGDGKLDLAATNSADGTVSILLGNGDGTFQVAGHYAAASAPASIVAGDFNGDGKIDLAVANSASNSVSVLIGHGDGTFAAPVDYAVGSDPVALIAGDFNADGKLDLAVANSASGNVSVLIGRGASGFAAAVNYGVVGTLNSLAAGDINGDGKLDLVAVGSSAVSPFPSVSILLGNGNGTFQAAVANPNAESSALALGDFNGDGTTDFATGGGNGVLVVLGNRTASLPVPADDDAFFTDYYPGPVSALVVGDFNGDGGLDLAAAVPNSNSVSVLLGDFDGTFEGMSAESAGTHYYSYGPMAPGDFNGDGKLDLVTTSLCDPIECGGTNGLSGVTVSLGNGDLTFSDGNFYALVGLPDMLEIGDFNADGKLDVAVEIPVNPFSIPVVESWYLLLGNGDGTLQQAMSINGPPSGTLFTPFVDFNGDGVADQVVTNADGTISIMLANGPTLPGPGTYGPFSSITAGDFTGDGLADLVGYAPTAGGLNPLFATFLNHAAIAIYPNQLVFNPGPGGPSSQSVTISNPGAAPLQISSITASGDFTQTNNCVSTLFSTGTCAITITSTLAGTGTSTGSIGIVDNAPGSPHAVTLTAVSGPLISFSASSVSLGGEIVGTTSGGRTVTLTNSGNMTLTISGITISPASFSETNTCKSTLAAGASCSITVTFTPTAAGAISGTLRITDNAPGSPHQVILTGTGQDFSIGPYNLSQSVPRGVTVPYDLKLTPEGGFNQTVSLACSGAPAQSTCSVTPASTTLDGRNPVVITLRVVTQGASSVLPASRRPMGRPLGLPHAWLGTLILIVLLLGAMLLVMLRTMGGATGHDPVSPDRMRLRIWTPAATLVLLTLVWIACGGGGAYLFTPPSGGTPSGNYVVTVTATSGHLSHAATVQLTVQ